MGPDAVEIARTVSEGCVLVCPGRSLFTDGHAELGLPICAVSSAIRCVILPDFWIFLERPTHHGYAPDGEQALRNPWIIKVTIPSYAHFCVDEQTHYIDPPPTKRAYSLHMAIHWLVDIGCPRLVFSGLDLDGVYAHDRVLEPAVAEQMPRVHLESALPHIRKTCEDLAAKVSMQILNPSSPAAEFLELACQPG